jgi:type 1 fimbria pilin
MRNAFLAGLLLATVACGAYRFPATSPEGTGSVSGQVVAVPCAPVESGLNPCMGRPASGIVLLYSNGPATAATTTDPSGNYSIQLDAGTWTVSIKGFERIISGPRTVTVTPGNAIQANYVVDSGIR